MEEDAGGMEVARDLYVRDVGDGILLYLQEIHGPGIRIRRNGRLNVQVSGPDAAKCAVSETGIGLDNDLRPSRRARFATFHAHAHTVVAVGDVAVQLVDAGHPPFGRGV